MLIILPEVLRCVENIRSEVHVTPLDKQLTNLLGYLSAGQRDLAMLRQLLGKLLRLLDLVFH